jgi:hypothetical protein
VGKANQYANAFAAGKSKWMTKFFSITPLLLLFQMLASRE